MKFTLLKMDEPTVATGRIYPKEVMQPALEKFQEQIVAGRATVYRVHKALSDFYDLPLSLVIGVAEEIKIEDNLIVAEIRLFPHEEMLYKVGHFSMSGIGKVSKNEAGNDVVSDYEIRHIIEDTQL